MKSGFPVKCVRPVGGVDFNGALSKRSKASKAEKETEFLKMVFENRLVSISDLKGRFQNASYLVDKWIKKGILERHTVSTHQKPGRLETLPPAGPHTLEYLSAEGPFTNQNRPGTGKILLPFCLYGVTGSGKTEVYAGAVDEVIKSGRQAILMAPEILLAGYLEGVFRHRLGDRVALYHSGLTKRERQYQWSRMAAGDVDLVIGARSALFAPLPSAGAHHCG